MLLRTICTLDANIDSEMFGVQYENLSQDDVWDVKRAPPSKDEKAELEGGIIF